MLSAFKSEPFLDGLSFAEGPRWRRDRLWFSDIDQHKVFTADEAGSIQVVAELDRPSGLGFLSDGSLLVVGMRTRSVHRVDAERVTPFADLSGLAYSLNDMVVTPEGRAYVGCYRAAPMYPPSGAPDGSVQFRSDDINGYYVNGLGTSPIMTGDIALVSPEGSVKRVASGIRYPNGLAVTPDGRTLIISVSYEGKLLACDIDETGELSPPRLWADLPGRHPDGICLDAEGAVWVACVATSSFLRVLEGGVITHQVLTPGRWAIAPALGSSDGRTLFVISMEPAHVPGHRSWIEAVRVDVPGVGRP